MLRAAAIDPKTYRDAMAQIAEAVHVVTTDGPHGRRGLTATAFTSVSDRPATVLVCVNRSKEGNALFLKNGVFAVSTLASSQQPVADMFSGLGGHAVEERFAIGEWETGETGAPMLKGCLASFDCRISESVDVATHHVLFGRVTGIRIGDSLSPLIYHRRAYRSG